MFRKYFCYFLFVIFFTGISFLAMAQLNLVQRSLLPFPGQRLAGVWHYVDPLNHEYALVGTEHGISIVDVTNPDLPVFILQIPGISNKWHEIKTWVTYAYATTEGTDSLGIKDGLQIIDLRYLPDSAPAHYWHGDGTIAGQLHRAHTVTVDNGFVYINGHDVYRLHSGVIIADLNDPWNPHYVGADTLNYCHDSFVRGDTLWASELWAGQLAVYNISNRANPVLLATQPTPGAFNHNAWLSDNSRVLFTTDERNHAPLASFDVSDFNNIELLDKYSVMHVVDSNQWDVVHNVRVLNDFLINACYGSQITLVDAAHPENLVEVGNFPMPTALAWDVDPFLPSGNILATGQTTGLYVLTPTYVRACYLEGSVTDSLTAIPLNNVLVQLLSTVVKDSTKFTGNYKTGYLLAGTYRVRFSKPGYFSKIISGVILQNGVLTTVNTQLVRDFTSIEELNSTVPVSVFPDPFCESTQMAIDEKFFKGNQSLSVLIKDATGRLVKKISHVISSPVKIAREKLGNGMYFYELRNETDVVAKGKFIIQ